MVVDPASKYQPSSFSDTTCRHPLFGAQRYRSSGDESGGKPEEGLPIMQPARCIACPVKPQSCLRAWFLTSRKATTCYWKKPGKWRYSEVNLSTILDSLVSSSRQLLWWSYRCRTDVCCRSCCCCCSSGITKQSTFIILRTKLTRGTLLLRDHGDGGHTRGMRSLAHSSVSSSSSSEGTRSPRVDTTPGAAFMANQQTAQH